MGKTNGLRVLEAAQLMVGLVLAAVEDFPARDPAGIKRQLCEAANSVPANIAEGYGRTTTPQRLYSLGMARGSLEETQSHLKVSRSSCYIIDKKFWRIWNLTVVINRMLTKLISET